MSGDAPAKARKQPLQICPEFLFPYDTRFVPLPVPSEDVCDFPQVQLCLNSHWASHLDGLLERLLFRDAWTGTDEEIDRGIFQTSKILAMLGELAMGCCCGNNFPTRFNADGDLEISYDGGATWQPYPQGDPRQNATLAPPLPGPDDDDKKCQAAANVTDALKNQADKLIADGGLWSGIGELVAAILGILLFVGVIGSGGLLTPIALGLGGALLGVGLSAFNAAMTSTVYDTLNCILYCHISADASFTDDAITAIKADIASQLTGIASQFLRDNITLLGKVGLTNAARTPSSRSFDCSSCDCGLNIIWTSLPEQVDVGTVEFQGDGVWRVTLGTRDFDSNLHSAGAFKDSADRCFKITQIDLVSGSYTREYRGLCAGGEGYGTILDECITFGVFDRYLATPQVETVVVDITAELC